MPCGWLAPSIIYGLCNKTGIQNWAGTSTGCKSHALEKVLASGGAASDIYLFPRMIGAVSAWTHFGQTLCCCFGRVAT